MWLNFLLRWKSDFQCTRRDRKRRPQRHERPRFVPRLEALECRTLPSTFMVLNLADSGSGSLRQAVLDANANPGANVIDFAPSLSGTITLTSGQLSITNDLTIGGPGASALAVSGNNASRVFQIDAGVQAELDGLTITHGRVTNGVGAGIYNYGTLTVSNSTLSGNSAMAGAGIRNDGTLTVSNSILSGNSATGGAGGISNYGTLTVTGSTLSGNSATAGAGGIFNSGTVTISNSTLSDNFATGGGGVIYNHGPMTVTGSTLSGNTGNGGIWNYTTLTVTGSTLSGNSTTGWGGAINNIGTVTVSNSTLSGNSAAGNGGAIYNGGTVTVSNSTLSGNSTMGSAGNGGGIDNDATLTVSNSTLSGNLATGNGGGILSYINGTLTVSNSTVSGNSATLNGGGIDNRGMLTVSNSTLSANSATGTGGGLFVGSGSPVLHNTLIAGNFRGATGMIRSDVLGPLNANGDYNLIGDGTGMTGISNGVHGNLVGSADAPIDPLLGPLQDNGGPTWTRALLAGSPALNAGNPNQLGVPDQRGVVRAGNINIGAYQASDSAFVFTAPATVLAGVPFDVIVTAVDPFGQAALGYTGTVSFGSTDPDAGVVLPADYTFSAADQGTHAFSGEFTLLTPGDQTLTADDRDGGFGANAVVTVDGGRSAPAGHRRADDVQQLAALPKLRALNPSLADAVFAERAASFELGLHASKK
jgi:hypothetical protein